MGLWPYRLIVNEAKHHDTSKPLLQPIDLNIILFSIYMIKQACLFAVRLEAPEVISQLLKRLGDAYSS